MGVQLLCRAGDSQALKACIGAAASKAQLTVVASADAPCAPLGTPSIRLQLSPGCCIHEANAAASYLAGKQAIRCWFIIRTRLRLLDLTQAAARAF